MPKKIEKLTSEQESQISVYRDLGIRIGLSTEPADREQAEAGVKLAYKLVGLKPPKNFIWYQSPIEGMKKAIELNKTKVQVEVQVWDQVGAQVRDQVKAQIWAQVWDQVVAQVVAQVREQVKAQVRDQVRNNFIFPSYGPHEIHWIVYYKYFQEVCNVKGLEILEGLWKVASSSGWWWPFEDTVILTERHCELHLDSERKLHNETGMAVQYSDGWGIYALNGKPVEEKNLPIKPLKRFYYLNSI